jgi:hypothetical protein
MRTSHELFKPQEVKNNMTNRKDQRCNYSLIIKQVLRDRTLKLSSNVL